MRKRAWLQVSGFVVTMFIVSGTFLGTVTAAGDGENEKATGNTAKAVSFEVAKPDRKHGRGIIYAYPDGKRTVLWGDLQFRNNNPGCLRYNDDKSALAAGAIGRDVQGFAVFPDYDAGKQASDAWWDRVSNEGLTIDQAVNRLFGEDTSGRVKEAPSAPGTVSDGDSGEGYVNVTMLSLEEAFKTAKDRYASAYELRPNGGDGPVGPPARVCFEGSDIKDRFCFDAKTESGNGYHGYNTVSNLSIIPIFRDRGPRYAVLFVASGCAYGRDLGNFATLWIPREKGHRSPRLIFAARYRTLLGGSALLSTIRPDLQGLAATADYELAEGEGDYNPHRYRVKLYRYSEKTGRFEPVGGFVTKAKYDDLGVDSIFRSEMKGIEELCKRSK